MGLSGVPFMKSTTGFELTTASICLRTSVERYREAIGENLGTENLEANVAGRATCRNAYTKIKLVSTSGILNKLWISYMDEHTDDIIGLAIILN